MRRDRARLPPRPALHSRLPAALVIGALAPGFATQMVAVAVGWQVYAIHRSAFDLGLIGLAEFAAAAPARAAGGPARRPAAADARRLRLRASRTRRSSRCSCSSSRSAARDQLWPFLALAALTGVAQAVRRARPARSLTPELVPAELLTGALALRSVAGQVATIAGPAVGGLLFAIQPEAGLRARRPCSLLVAGVSLLRLPKLADASRRGRSRAAAPREPARRDPLDPRHADHPRRDHARPLRRALRRRRRAAAALRAARSCTPARSGSACCAARPPSAR